jgi:O-antigen ligase
MAMAALVTVATLFMLWPSRAWPDRLVPWRWPGAVVARPATWAVVLALYAVIVLGLLRSQAFETFGSLSAKGAHTYLLVLIGMPLYAVAALTLAGVSGADRALVLRAVAAAVALTSFMLLIEVVFDHPLLRAAREPLAPDAIDLTRQYLERGLDQNLGRSAAGFALIALPAAALLIPLGWRSAAVAVLGLVSVAAAAVASDTTAVAAALGAALLVTGVALLAPRITASAVSFGGAALFLAGPLIGWAAAEVLRRGYGPQIPFSWEQRLQIWANAGEEIAQAPLLGLGLESGRVTPGTFELRGFEFDRIGLHPHSAPLQVWMDMGAVGALAVAAVFAVLGVRMARGPLSRVQGAAVAGTLTVGLMIGAASFGLWQEWWLAVLALASGLVGLTFQKPEQGR